MTIEPSPKPCVVLTTAASDTIVEAIAEKLLGAQLAACIQVSPIRSYYVWKGAIAKDSEQLLLIKARSEDYAQIEAAIRSVHDYDVPEIIRLDIAEGSKPYLDWLAEVTQRPSKASD
jgi:periplasmic divalent cation tolerance protein